MSLLTLADALEYAGIGNIAFADRDEKVFSAIRQLESCLGKAKIEYFEVGSQLISRIQQNSSEIDLILTDRDLDIVDSGFYVIQNGWEYYIPSFICLGGFKGITEIKTFVAPEGISTPQGLTKDNPNTWYVILDYIAKIAVSDSENLINSTYQSRKDLIGGRSISLGESVLKKTKTELTEKYVKLITPSD